MNGASERLARRLGFGIGATLLTVLALTGMLGQLPSLPDPIAQDLLVTLQAPSWVHPLGTDHLGRDILARVVYGAPRSLGIALLCVSLSAALGVSLGLAAALGGRWTDILIMRLADMALAFPGLLLALLLAGFLGGGMLAMMIGLQVSLWPMFGRMARASARQSLHAPHVEAARLAGFSRLHIVRHHLLPPILRQTVSLAALGIGSAILSISSLGFLGLGLQPPVPEWGAMISELLPYVTEAPLQMAAPCLLIVASVFGFLQVGERFAARIGTEEA